MSVVVPITIIAGLILLNALFVAAEFAIVGAPRTSIARRASSGDRLAALVDRTLRDPRRQDRYIATAQLGITFATLGLGMYGEHQLAVWIEGWFEAAGVAELIAVHAVSTVLAVAVMTYFHVVVGEMVPKSLALQGAQSTAIAIAVPMEVVKWLLYPLVIALNGIGNGVLRLAGVDRAAGSSEQYYSPEELELIVEESLQGGVLGAESGRVLRELFEFGDLTAGELMTPRVHVAGIPIGAPPDELARIMREEPHTRYPVFEGDLDGIRGMLHVKDVLRLLVERAAVTPERVRQVPFVPETARLDVLLDVMRERATQLVVVLDEHGGTAGIVTVEDLFEEVVGSIEESVATLPEVHRDVAGVVHVQGTVRLDELGEQVGVPLHHEEVDSVSGLILMLLDRPPVVGDRVEFGGLGFEVVAVEGHGVSQALVKPLIPATPPGERSDAG